MAKTIIRRLLILIFQLFFISVFVFFVGNIMPGDVIASLITEDSTYEEIAHLREIHGLNYHWHVRYINWMVGIFTEANFGRSITQARSVNDLITERAINTIRLSIATVILIYLVSIPLAIISAKKMGTIIDKTILIYSFVILAIPTVVLALINIFTFGIHFSLFPVRGSVNVTVSQGTYLYYLSILHHLALPAITGALIGTIGIIFFLRSELIENQNSDYVITARSKGVPLRKIYHVHILKNSLLPIVSNFGSVIAGLLTGSIFIEQVFSFPGVGSLFITSIMSRDFPVVNTLVLIFSFLTAIGVLIGDILIVIIDPRIRIK